MQYRVAGMASRRALGDRLAAGLALAVGAVVELGQGPLHLVELAAELGGEDLVLALLGGHLAGVGEVVVEGAGAPPGCEDEIWASSRSRSSARSLRTVDSRDWSGIGPGYRPCSRPGVSVPVHLPQPLGGDERVHLRGADRGVPEQLLHGADVGTVVQHVGRAGVAQHVRG